MNWLSDRMRTTRFSLVVFAIAWLFVVTFAYFIANKPFALDNAIAVADTVANILVVALLVALAWSIGHRLLHGFEFMPGVESAVLNTALGMGVLALATLLIGMFVINGILFWVILLASLFLLRRDVAELVTALRAVRIESADRFEKFSLAFIVIVSLLALLSALTPPLGWDAQIYHLAIGKSALETGRIVAPHDRFTFSYPSFGEMLYLLAMALKSDIAAQSLGAISLPGIVLMLYAMATRYLTPRIGILAGAFSLAAPSFVSNAASAYVDAPLAFFALAAFYTFLVAREKGDSRYYMLAGVFAGCAAGFKYNAAIVPVGLALLNLVNRASLKSSLALVGMSLAAAAPWYIRNWIFMGNPIYPFVWGGPDWDSFRAAWLARPWSGFVNEPLRVIFAPWYATVLGQDGALNFEATIGIFFLALIPLLAVAGNSGRVENGEPKQIVRPALLFSLLVYLVWLAEITYSDRLVQTRFLFIIFPILALIAAYAFERLRMLDTRAFSLYRFASLLILAVLALTLFGQVISFARLNPFPYLVGSESRDRFLARTLYPPGYWTVLQKLNTLSSTDRVLLLWDGRTLHFPLAQSRIQPDQMGDNFAHLVFLYPDLDILARHLRSEGYTHILLSREDLDFVFANQTHPIEERHLHLLESLLTNYFRRVDGPGRFELVRRDGVLHVANAETETYALYTWKEPR